MLCQKCNKAVATYHQLDLEDGTWVQRHVCEQCALGVELAPPPAKALGSIGKILIEATVEPRVDPEDEFSCPGCSMSYSTFRKQRRLGCQRCYETFHSDLVQIFRRVQEHTNHRGKVPGRPNATPPAPLELERLRSNLQRAIEEERFEDAALYRDKMRRLTDDTERT
ncbi:MAG: UvrB/UvrC motif-containing protein [Planctomycetes bacterium]|nr:UvrB/UvrC motif-containing protein [Planctomycetota bacterium]